MHSFRTFTTSSNETVGPRTATRRRGRGRYPDSFTVRATLVDANVSVINPNVVARERQQAESSGQYSQMHHMHIFIKTLLHLQHLILYLLHLVIPLQCLIAVIQAVAIINY